MKEPSQYRPASTEPAGHRPHPSFCTLRVAYLARKQAEGKTKREALRCLKRRLSNVVFKAMLAGPKPSDVAA
jgi:ribosomal protein S4